eukprot:3777469-Pleurochrysis_carterae.AAC.1
MRREAKGCEEMRRDANGWQGMRRDAKGCALAGPGVARGGRKREQKGVREGRRWSWRENWRGVGAEGRERGSEVGGGAKYSLKTGARALRSVCVDGGLYCCSKTLEPGQLLCVSLRVLKRL